MRLALHVVDDFQQFLWVFGAELRRVELLLLRRHWLALHEQTRLLLLLLLLLEQKRVVGFGRLVLLLAVDSLLQVVDLGLVVRVVHLRGGAGLRRLLIRCLIVGLGVLLLLKKRGININNKSLGNGRLIIILSSNSSFNKVVLAEAAFS